MLSSLFKPGWQSDSIEKRLQAVTKLDPASAANQSILESLAMGDSDNRVRQAALEKVSKPGALFHIFQTHTESQTRENAKAALIRLIGAKSSLSKEGFEAFVAEHPKARVLLVQHCPDASLRTDLLEGINELDRAGILSQVEYSDTRKLIVEKLSSKQALEHARKSIKGKDKTAEKSIKLKLATIRAEEKQQQDNQDAADKVCRDMEFIANHAQWRSEFKARFASYETSWTNLGFTPEETIQSRYVKAQSVAKEKVERQTTLEAAQQTQADLAKSLEGSCADLAQCTLSMLVDKRTSLSEQINTSLNDWLQQASIETPLSTVADCFLDAQKALKSIVELCSKALDPENTVAFDKALAQLYWPKHYPTLHAKAEARSLVDDLNAQKKQAKQSEKEQLDSLHKRINRLQGITKRGDIRRAKQELAATTKLANKFDGKNRTILDERLVNATEAVNKISDWQAFATEPKFMELCDAMDGLVKSTDHPDKLAKKIKALQQRWKGLGHSEVSDQYWERFKAASDLAYEPCSVFFKERRAIRRVNLEKREPLVERMRELLEKTSWDDEPDYRLIETELRNISNDWQKIKDVEQGEGQRQWARLSAIKADIYQHLDIVYDANIKLKEQIVTNVEALLSSDIKEESIDKLQLFQSRWKKVGVTRRKQDQAAWKKFKFASDQVYEKIQAARQDKRTQENTQLQVYRDVIKNIQSAAKSATDITQADALIDDLQAQFRALPPLPEVLPEKVTKEIESNFSRALNAYDKARERLAQQVRSQIFDGLAEKAALCGRLEMLDANAKSEEIEAIREDIAAIELDDKALNNRFDARLAAAFDVDRTQANEARRRLCIDLEILLGAESPAEDKSLRMEIQIEQMKTQGIGHDQVDRTSRLNELRIDWLCLPGADSKLQSLLDERFQGLIAR